ncbi:DUF2142 domain-containing protein [Pseudarthrobacter phenanthrenivorans]|uniref:DUF2142 domain-containing protein n=1 Tax=Pseudarthrobacter phenanthrenivorans TaxID=361575 RepID=UPI00112CB737|nr:DUF2142 domain-containing protein [Pseudarthrobacter phenanthrenivorans]TPV49174.1 DUF2142 domain-containing protein [Pseudarthrobacter phenanthrenivorans]
MNSSLKVGNGMLLSRATSLDPNLKLANLKESPSGLRFFLSTFALIFAFHALWTIATPLMAYPDEPAHTIKAAAVTRGQLFPAPGESFGHGVHVQVPAYIGNLPSQMCFAFAKEKTADCAPEIPLDDDYPAIAVTSAGIYNPMYYFVVGLPSLLLSGAPALYAMRIISALLSAIFYATAFTALSRLRHPRWPMIAAVVATTPMVMFLGAGINPNSLELAASTAAFCGLVSVFEHSTRLHLARPGLMAVAFSAVILANTRNVSVLWLVCAAIIAGTLYGGSSMLRVLKDRAVLITLAVTSVGVGLGVSWSALMLQAPPSSGEAPVGISNFVDEIRPYNAFLTMLDRSFDFVSQYIGTAGWLDTPMPQGVLIFWNMALMGLVLMVFTVRPRRLQTAVWIAIFLLAVVPAVVQAAIVNASGYIWQGRYSLPLFMMAVISAGLALRFKALRATPANISISRILILAGCVAHLYAFLTVLRRYVVGLPNSGNWQTMITVPSWQPPLSWEGLAVLFSVTLLIAAAHIFAYLFPGEKLLPWWSKIGKVRALGRSGWLRGRP